MTSLYAQMLVAAMCTGQLKRYRPPEDILQGVDIDREYQLIMKKQSRLSLSRRNEVIRRYNNLHIS